MNRPSGTKRKPVARAKRPAWANRFAVPTLTSLLQGLRAAHSNPFRHARQTLLDFPGMQETIAWQGVWHWTLVYSHPSLPNQAWAFLVPDPARPLLAVPIPEVALLTLPQKHLTRPVRDGLTLAPVVGGVRWATWEVSSKTLAENVLAVAAARASVARATGGTAARSAS